MVGADIQFQEYYSNTKNVGGVIIILRQIIIRGSEIDDGYQYWLLLRGYITSVRITTRLCKLDFAEMKRGRVGLWLKLSANIYFQRQLEASKRAKGGGGRELREY